MKKLILVLTLFSCVLGVQAQQEVQAFNVAQRVNDGQEETIEINIIMTISDGLISFAGGLDDVTLYTVLKKVYQKDYHGNIYTLKNKDGLISMLLYAPIFDEQGKSLGNSAVHIFYDQDTNEEVGRIIYRYQAK